MLVAVDDGHIEVVLSFTVCASSQMSWGGGGVHCVQSPCGSLSSLGETGSWGFLYKKSLWGSGCCQETRQRGIKHLFVLLLCDCWWK